jgi:hypothetical protein
MHVSTHTLKRNSLMEKQTATEWLFKQLWEEPKDKLTWNTILSKAKEMHKEEIINAVDLPKEKRWYDAKLYNSSGEQYYNETFKNK